MGKTIEEHIEQLKQIPIHDKVSLEYLTSIYETIDAAIDTMRKYQKIEQIVNEYNLQLCNNTSDGAYNFQRIREVLEDGRN